MKSCIQSPLNDGINAVQTYLQGDENLEWVLDMDRQWKQQQIGGVPFFIFNDKYGMRVCVRASWYLTSVSPWRRFSFSGAQEVEMFESVFKKLGGASSGSA